MPGNYQRRVSHWLKAALSIPPLNVARVIAEEIRQEGLLESRTARAARYSETLIGPTDGLPERECAGMMILAN